MHGIDRHPTRVFASGHHNCHASTLSLSCEAPASCHAVERVDAATGREREFIAVNEEELRKRLDVLRIEHRDLDAAIDALTGGGSTDQLQIARLKKRKLLLRDQISMVEDYLIPDIIA